MVDPNRKINRLNEKDIEFLDECEEEFKDRFSELDEDFMAHCRKEPPQPPIVENWRKKNSFNKHDNRRGGGGFGNRRGGNPHYQRHNSGGFNDRHDRNRYGQRNHPYARNNDRSFGRGTSN